METFIDRYIAQGKQLGEQRGEAKMLLRQIERKFGPPSETVRTPDHPSRFRDTPGMVRSDSGGTESG